MDATFALIKELVITCGIIFALMCFMAVLLDVPEHE